MSPAAKLIYTKRAREAENLPFNERTESERAGIKKGLLKQLDNILQKLHNCSVDVAAVAIEGINIHFLGPKDGLVLQLLRDKEEEMVDRVIKNKYASSDNMKEDVRNIRKKAQEHFNQLYASATGSRKPFPYKAVDCGTIIIEGLPDELVPLKVPSKYGIAKLKMMLDVKLIHIKRNEQALTSTLHIPTDIHTIPQTDIHTITQADIHTIPQTDIHTIPQTDIHTITQADIHTIPQTDILTITQADIHTIPQTDIHTIPQTDIQTITQADIHTIPQTDIHTITQADIHTIPQTDIQTITQADIHTITQADIHTTPQTDIHTITQADIHTIPQTDIHTITQADIHTIPQTDIHTITQTDIHTIAQTDIHTIPQTDIHTITQADIQTITQADIHTIAQADIHTITQADIPIITQETDIHTNTHTNTHRDTQSNTHTDPHTNTQTDLCSNTQTNTQIHLDTAVKGELNNDYEVERIVRKRRRRGTNEYLLRWKGFSSKDDTWEKEENLNQFLLQIAKNKL